MREKQEKDERINKKIQDGLRAAEEPVRKPIHIDEKFAAETEEVMEKVESSVVEGRLSFFRHSIECCE